MGILNEKKSTFQRFGTIFNSQNVYYIYQTNKKRNKKFRIIYTLTSLSLYSFHNKARGSHVECLCFSKRATATKTSLENKHLGNGDYFAIIASSSHPLSLTENAANALVEAPLT